MTISKEYTEELILRVWWSSKVPITKTSLEVYPVNDINEAIIKIKELTERDLKIKDVTDNVGGLWCNSKKEEYIDDEGRDIMEIIDNEEILK